jgi:membrane-bound serine protease (ClpP class)
VLLFGARYLVGLADIPHIVAAFVGLGLIAAELFVAPGTIWLGLAGFACLLVAIVFGQLGPGFDFSNALDREALREVVDELVLGLAGAIVIAWLVSRWLPETPFLRRLVLAPKAAARPGEAVPDSHGAIAIGALGKALTDLRPVGKVVLDSEPAVEYEARAEGLALERGARVRVVELGAGRLVVAGDAARAANDPSRTTSGS